jgi:hypothetical protein
MFRRPIFVASILILFPIARGAAQVSGPSQFVEQAGALQSKLTGWRQRLNNLRFGARPAVSAAESQLLREDRLDCLKWISILDSDITKIESAATLAGEVRVVLDIEHLQGAIANMDDSLRPATSLGIASSLQTFDGSLGHSVFHQLRGLGKAHAPGEISGHIYRTDTGGPLAGARIMLGPASSFRPPLRSVETSASGSYAISNVPPGQYRVGAYLKGFTYGQYGPSSRIGPEWATINLAPSQKLSGIDMRLHPLASVTQMNEQALDAKFGVGRFSLNFGPGLFSPDGKVFAFGVGDPDPYQAWLYNLGSKHLMPITEKPATGSPHICGMAWVGETLYAEASPEGCPYNLRFFAATTEGTQQISTLPAAAQGAPSRATARQHGTVSKGRFTVSAVPPTCYHCTGLNLTARRAGGGKPYVIAKGSWELGSFALENHGSLVLFPRFYYAAIAMVDLNTRRAQEAYLPNRAERLLDARPESGGYLVAYTSYGPCQGYGDQGGLYPIHPQRAPYNVCFATILYQAKEGLSGAHK